MNNYLIEILKEENTVILPGFGAFTVVNRATNELMFMSFMKYNDGTLVNFIAKKYDMSFSDLVNKNRVDYFIDIIHNAKYLNFTIDALAKEAGFSSRQHLYKPFKKFHGGNPSDIMDAFNG